MDGLKNLVAGFVVIGSICLFCMGMAWIGMQIFPVGETPMEACTASCALDGVKYLELKSNGKIEICECQTSNVVEIGE